MKAKTFLLSLAMSAMLLTSSALADGHTELRFLWFDDGFQSTILQPILDDFMAENPDISITLDILPYATVRENYKLWLESGEAPDIGKVTDLGGLSEYYLDISGYTDYVDGEYWEANYGPYNKWLDPQGNGGIYGYQNELTVTGPFINKTYFEQAGVEIPGDDASWDDWAAAASEVAEAVSGDGLQVFAMGMDRSGHRVAGPAVSQGASYFDDEGNPALAGDEGFADMMQKMVDWHADGTMMPDIWVGVGGGTYASGADAFINGELVLLMSGSWQLGNLADKIGDAFDWTAINNPCGPGGCTGMPGGAANVGFASTEHPEAVARVLAYLASEDAYRSYAEGSVALPAHIGLASSGLDYGADNPSLASALDTFVAQVPQLSPTTFALQGYPKNFVVFNATVARLSQALTGELSVEDAIAKMQEDIEEQINQ